jgi:hypothetical protein
LNKSPEDKHLSGEEGAAKKSPIMQDGVMVVLPIMAVSLFSRLSKKEKQ